MASFMDRMKSGITLGKLLVDKGERYGGAFALGYARALDPGGATVDRIGTLAGIAATAAGIALADTLGASAAHVERAGDVLLMDRACCEGLRWGRSLSGRWSETLVTKPRAVVGRGPFLSPEEIANYARHR